MSKHTKEPWCLPPGDLIFVSKVGGGGYIAKMMPLDAPRDRKGLPTDISDEMCANARRIVACVNACRGLPTDELEQKGLVAAVGTQLLELEQQRDGLLVALEELASDVEALMKESGGVYGLHQNGEPAPWAELVAGGKHEEWLLSLSDAVELIAKLKGGAA